MASQPYNSITSSVERNWCKLINTDFSSEFVIFSSFMIFDHDFGLLWNDSIELKNFIFIFRSYPDRFVFTTAIFNDDISAPENDVVFQGFSFR